MGVGGRGGGEIWAFRTPEVRKGFYPGSVGRGERHNSGGMIATVGFLQGRKQPLNWVSISG